MAKVFLSYARLDHEPARRLFDEMYKWEGIEVWFDEENILPGMRWEPVIRKAIRESDYFVAMFSKQSSTEEGFRHSELKQAIDMMESMPENRIYIIPMRLDDSEPPSEKLRGIHIGDLRDWDDGVDKLKRSLGVTRRRSKPDPATIAAHTLRKEDRQSGEFAANARRPNETRRTREDYFYQVHLINLDVQNLQLREIAEGLNDVQSFVFLKYEEVNPSRKAQVRRDDEPQLYIDYLSRQFYNKISPLEFDHALCVTRRCLTTEEDGYEFSNYLALPSPEDDRVSFGSIADYDIYAQEAGISVESAFAVFVVADLVTFFLDLDYHRAIRGCPLDRTMSHRRLVDGFKKRQFCDECLKELDADSGLRDAVIAMLAWNPA